MSQGRNAWFAGRLIAQPTHLITNVSRWGALAWRQDFPADSKTPLLCRDSTGLYLGGRGNGIVVLGRIGM